jgi:pyruvate dehydrogenase (quinone)
MQDVNTVELMKGVALYNTAVSSAGHAMVVTDIACRAALGGRGVAHITVPKDVQAMKLSADKPSMEYHGLRTSSAWLPDAAVPAPDQLLWPRMPLFRWIVERTRISPPAH